MPIKRTFVTETDEYQMFTERDASIGYEAVVYEPKAGSRQANTEALKGRMTAALAQNATYLGLANPTAAQQRNQLEFLTREVTALLKLSLDRTEDVAGT